MPDIYLYDDVPVLRNKLEIKDEKELDTIEAERSRARMMILYRRGFDDFTPAGLCAIHQYLFGDIYDWAGQYRIINIAKREMLLAGQSVWYSNDEDIPRDLDTAFAELHRRRWKELFRTEFVRELARCFPRIWQVHPFREGNTRTVVMMMTFFVESFGYHMDQDLMASCAGYVRDSFVMASLDQNSEYEHLEKILLDAVCNEPIRYTATSLENSEPSPAQKEKYRRYQKDDYIPQPHYRREDN
ncbi:MAG: Fic family protein [Oscillospiraceae bacterium]|nr:Fic family protein [Oscillospiraceae bacterium]